MTTVYDTEFSNTLTVLFGGPFYSGTSASTGEVPGKYNVALDGRGFMIDGTPHGFMKNGQPHWNSIATNRPQQDSREAGELSLNSEGLWRRSNSSWDLGAGQIMYDDENSQRQRFHTSKGVNVWTPGKATLLPDTVLQATVDGAASHVDIESTANHVYWSDLNTMVRSDLTTQTNVTGTPATAITSIISTGSYVLVGYTGNGVYKIAAGATVGAAWMTDAVTPSIVGWAKGRVMVGVANAIYNPTTVFTSSAALPTPLLAHPDTSFRWVGVGEGTSWIYMGGVVGDKSIIYRTIIRADATSLDVPTVAGRLPDGEILTSMYGYLGVLVLGTTHGFRIAEPNGNGDLVLGRRVDLGVSVLSMMGRDTFVYFGWSNYDATSTGVGRMDLSNLTDTDNIVPAYASDLMAPTQGSVNGIAFLADDVVFGVNNVGVYKQAATLVGSGTISTGIIRYGLTEEKVVVGARASYTGIGTVTLEMARDGGAFSSIGANGAQQRGINFEMRATITQPGSNVSPVFHSMTLFAYPAAEPTLMIDLSVLIAEKVKAVGGVEAYMNIAETLDFLRDRWKSKVLVAYQEGARTFQVTLQDIDFQAMNEAQTQIGDWNGTATLALKVVT